jgi:hypothetical protein
VLNQRAKANTRPARRLLSLLLCATWAWFATPGHAQSDDSCRPTDGASRLRSTNSTERAATAQALIADWRTTVPTLIKELETFDGSTEKWSSDQQAYFATISDVLRSIVTDNTQAITLFRQCDNERAIRSLAWAARSTVRSIRVNGTYVLASVADNTNVCILLHHLRDRSITPDGRVNLLQVVAVIAAYAYRQNIEAMRDTIKTLNANLSRTDQTNRTAELLRLIDQRAGKSINLDNPLPPSYQPCFNYNFAGELK